MNKKTKIAVAKISIPGTQSDELCYVFAERLDERNPHSDTVFGIFQIRSSSEAYHTIIERIVKHILDFYYRAQENSTSIHSEQAVGASEFLFENALQYANDHIVTMIEEMQNSPQGRIIIDRTRISLLIGVISGQDLFLTTTGNLVKAYMLYPVSRNGTFSHYSAAAITDEQNQERHIDAKKLFTNVIAGTFSIPGSTLVIANARFNDYIPIDQVKQIVTSYPFDHVTKYLYNLLGKANENADFNALFLSLQESDSTEDMRGGHRQTRSDDSINGLVEQQKNTQNILSPAVVGHMKEQVAHFMVHNIIKPAQGLRDRLKDVDYQKHATTMRTWGKHMSISARKGVSTIKKNYKNPLPVVKEFTHELASSKGKRKMAKLLKKTLINISEFYSQLKENGPRYIITWFKGLSMLSKGLLALSVIFIFLFVSSIVTLQRKHAQEGQSQAYTTLVQGVEQKINQAESSLIFQDDQRALALLTEAQAALKALPRASADQIKTSDALKNRIDQATQKIRKIYAVSPTTITNLENQIPTLSDINMASSATHTIVYNHESIYLLSTTGGTVTQVNTQAKIPSISCASFISDDVVYFCSAEGDRLYEVNLKTNDTKQVTVSKGKNETISNITFYNNRLYVLDPASNTVYRHSKTNTGFGDPTVWFRGTNTAPITDTRQILIDGTAYVLGKAASLFHITNSKATLITSPTIEPAVSFVDHLWVDEESSSLYLLDKANKRILVFDKATNKLTAQLTADILSDAQSLSVTEKKKEIIILTNNSIVSIPLAHLQ